MATKQPEQPQVPTKKTPIFVGKSALVRLVNGDDPSTATIWLVDTTNKTLRPFVSEDQFDQLFDNPDQAKKSITTLSADELGPNGLLGEFHVLDNQYGVKKNGSMKTVPFSPSQIQQRYGKPIDPSAENNAVSQLDGMFSQLAPGSVPPIAPGGASPASDPSMIPNGQPQGPQAPQGTGGPGSGTVYDGEEDLSLYDGQGGPNLRNGSTGPDVTNLQNQLNQYGYHIAVDGRFGPETQAAVLAFQGSHGLTQDGVVGPLTLAQLNNAGNNNGGNNNNNNGGNAGTNPTPTPTPSGVPYGQTSNPQAVQFEQGALTQTINLADQPTSGSSLTDAFLHQISNDPLTMAGYVNALAYGGYTMSDVYNDMYRRQQAAAGNHNYDNLVIISPTMPRTAYYATSAGQTASNISSTILPPNDGMNSPSSNISKYVTGLSQAAANSPVNFPSPDTPEGQAAIANIKSGYFDLLTAQASASTEEEKSLADYNMNQFNKQVQTYLGILLSNNSTQAWKQIQNLDQDAANRGIQGSGLENQNVDDTLKTARLNDVRNRTNSLNQMEQEKAMTMHSAGSADQIAALTPEQRQAWGLTPSADMLNQFSLANIKTKLGPNTTDAQAQAYRDKFIDQNGNYRSTLYQNYYGTNYGINYATPADNNRQAYQTTEYETEQMNAKKAWDQQNTPYSESDPNSSLGSHSTTNYPQGTPQNISPNYTPPPTNTPPPTYTPPPTNNTPPPGNGTPPSGGQSGGHNYSTLYDYYTGTSGGFNSWNSSQRMADAARAGISGYTGSGQQNTQLLGYLNSH